MAPKTIPYARWYAEMVVEAFESPKERADVIVATMRRLCAHDEGAMKFWFRPMPLKEAKDWLAACREDRATAREQIAKVQEAFGKIATGVSVDEAFKVE